MKNYRLKQIVYFAIVLLFISYKGAAQDIHFSQFYNSPLSLNPAMTGIMKEDIRGSVIYRSQWKQANALFKTMGFAGDMNFPIKPTSSDRIGVGLFVYNDKLGEGIILNNSVYLSLAYHKFIGTSKRLKLSGGVQGGYAQKTLDYSTLYFSSQINNYQFDPNISSGEPLGKITSGYMNINLGVCANYKLNTKTDLFTGVSFFNVNGPGENFRKTFGTADLNKLKQRFTWTGMAVYKLSNKLSLFPAVLIMKQAKALDFNVGSSIGYLLNGNKNALVQAGVWYRSSDAVIAMAGFRFNHINIGVSYDFTTSSLNDIKKSDTVKDNAKIGAFEVTLTYVGFLKRPIPGTLTVPCRFF